MSIVKFLAKRQISRQLFKVCRLNNFETRSQVESYFLEHRNFKRLKWCSQEDIKELEYFISADFLRLERKWEVSRDLLRLKSIVQVADFLLKKEVLPRGQTEVFKASSLSARKISLAF